MPRSDRRRLVALAVLAAALALAAAWLRAGGGSPEERAREKAAEIQQKAREATRPAAPH